MTNRPDFLARSPLFASLSDDDRARVEKRLVQRRYDRDEYIFFEGDPAEWLVIVAEGRVKVIKRSEGGRETILLRALTGGILSVQCASERVRSHASGRTCAPSAPCGKPYTTEFWKPSIASLWPICNCRVALQRVVGPASGEEHDFEIAGVRLGLLGYCAGCREKSWIEPSADSEDAFGGAFLCRYM